MVVLTKKSDLQHILDRIIPAYGKYIDVLPGWYGIILELDKQIAEIDPMAGARWAWSRGYLQHAVAWDGFTAHDPHPTRAGLTTISHLIEFEEAPDAR